MRFPGTAPFYDENDAFPIAQETGEKRWRFPRVARNFGIVPGGHGLAFPAGRPGHKRRPRGTHGRGRSPDPGTQLVGRRFRIRKHVGFWMKEPRAFVRLWGRSAQAGAARPPGSLCPGKYDNLHVEYYCLDDYIQYTMPPSSHEVAVEMTTAPPGKPKTTDRYARKAPDA